MHAELLLRAAIVSGTVCLVDEITIRFSEQDPEAQIARVAFEGDHVLDVEIAPGMRLCAVTVHNASLRLGASAAMGRPDAYRLVRDKQKDALCIEFREGASERSASLKVDAFEINGEQVLHLLWGPGEELEGLVILNASSRVGGSSPLAAAGTTYLPTDDALAVKLFAGTAVPDALQTHTTQFPGGPLVELSIDRDGRLFLIMVLEVSLWMNPLFALGQGVPLNVISVPGSPNTVALEIEAGGLARQASTDSIEIGGFEISATYDGDRRLVGFVVPNASRRLPPPFSGEA